jgi:PKHD-type hydroxylase
VIFPIDNILNSEELKFIIDNLERAEFIDGKTTAGWHAKLVKNNTQLTSKAPIGQQLQELVRKALKRNELFQIAIQPKIVHTLLFSRYEVGMSYGRHTDNALMGQDRFYRSDVSFTIFLNDPNNYVGGELVVEGVANEDSYKLNSGCGIFYPSSTLHRVETVTQGQRLVVVGWVQSLIRDPGEREILFDLDTTRRSLFAKQGKSIEFDLLSKTHANLLRKWSE